MNKKDLINSLRELNKKWVGYQRDSSYASFYERDPEKSIDLRIQSGELIIKFYEDFKESSASSKDENIIEIGKKFKGGVEWVKELINNNNYFGLGTIFVPWGSREGDPTVLENMIKNLESN